MYLSHYGLKEEPFRITPDLEFFYHQDSREIALASLKYAIDRGEGIIKIVGEVGSGKTTLLRLLASSLPNKFKIVLIPSPNLSPKDLLFYICSELGVDVDKSLSKHEVIKILQNALIEFHTNGQKVIVLIDEAQVAGVDTLEELRLLSNLETEKDKLLQLVLFGQTEFDVNLETIEAKPLRARISSEIYLSEFSVNEVHKYLNYRMRVAGYRENDLFTLKDAKKIFSLTDGLPRAINLIADKLLMSSFSDNRKFFSNKDYKVLGYKKQRSFLWLYIFIIASSIFGSLGVFYSNDLIEFKNTTVTQTQINVAENEIQQTHSPATDKQYQEVSSHLFDPRDVVLKEVVQKTQDLYHRIPEDFFTVLLYQGIKSDAIESKLKNDLVQSKDDKYFVLYKNNHVYVFYGYSNLKSVALQTLSQQRQNFRGWPKAKIISFEQLNAIIG